MLDRLRIKNFKAWKDTGDIRLAPLTVFFGTNSSGKTSLLQLLLLLKQTAQSSDRRRVLNIGGSRTLADLGTFPDLIFDHNTKATLEFELAWKSTHELKVRDSYSKRSYRSSKLFFGASIAQGTGQRVEVKSMAYRLGDPSNEGLQVGMAPLPSRPGKYELTAENYRPLWRPGRKRRLPPPGHFHRFPDEAVTYCQNTGFLADLTLELDQLLSRIHYVGPLREYPTRTTLWSGEVPEHVGETGDRAVEALLAAKERRISHGRKKRSENFQVLIARHLKSLGLIDSFEVRPIAKGRKEHEVVIRTRPDAPKVMLTDVGFGVSQVFPVIVECFYVPRHSTIIFEQPEIHLHPCAQAGLADLFIEAIHSRERREDITQQRREDRDIQLIVESHSEHFLRRLQRRIAEQKLTSDEVALYFCEPGKNGASIRELEVDEYGRITNWPKRFFGDIFDDTEQQLRGMIKRMKQPAQ